MSQQTDRGPRILQSCYAQVSRSGEQFIGSHTFSYVVAGGYDIYLNGRSESFKEGDFRFIAKNQLAKFTKYPPAGGGVFKSIGVIIDQQTLHSIRDEYHFTAAKPYTGETLLRLRATPLLHNFINSLQPYLHQSGELNAHITRLKVKEAVLLLLEVQPELKDLLFDFSEPGKIDLEAYMKENFRFNVDIGRFAYLTGRSLATFKRDFERIFHTPPGKWLMQQRLQEAHFLLSEKGCKVTEVYIDAGFSDLSHFSFAFKKAYGITPSKVLDTAHQTMNYTH